MPILRSLTAGAVSALTALTLAGRSTSPAAVAAPAPAAARSVVVAQDGRGDVSSIQAALDLVPAGNTTPRVILVRAGTYHEKLFVRTSHVSIIGESRETTRIEFAELRRRWRDAHADDWGAAVVNIADGVTDVTLANLTVRNNYGALHGDHDHQFAIRAGAGVTKVIILDANVIADGGDTLSLWNTDSGMYYHANSYFEGWVDYVCPRGWCYITDSRFVGHSATAGVWHDGSLHPESKFVIRRSTFDGDEGFALGRNNRDGQFYLVDCRFGAAMADRPLYLASPRESYQWGERYYYFNNHREGGDFAWFANNLASAPGAPRPRDITARWTFGGRWDPEAGLPSIRAAYSRVIRSLRK
jgi:pectinesterase